MQPEYIEILLHELADLSGKAAMAHFRARPGVTDKAGKSQRFGTFDAAPQWAHGTGREKES